MHADGYRVDGEGRRRVAADWADWARSRAERLAAGLVFAWLRT